jgi:hypothetical protein
MQFNASPVTQSMFYWRTAGLIQVMQGPPKKKGDK